MIITKKDLKSSRQLHSAEQIEEITSGKELKYLTAPKVLDSDELC